MESATSMLFMNLECGYSMLRYLAPLIVGDLGDNNYFGDCIAPCRDDALDWSFIFILFDMRYNNFKFYNNIK
jgi:hypothetical protein